MKETNEAGMHNKIVALAKNLKLTAFSDYKSYIKDGFSMEESLYHLLYAENSIKEQNRYKYRVKNAAFPIIKTLDTFVFDDGRLPNLNKDMVMELASCDFIKRKQNEIHSSHYFFNSVFYKYTILICTIADTNHSGYCS